MDDERGVTGERPPTRQQHNLNKAHEVIALLTARLASVEALVQLYREYVAFLDRENQGPVTLAFNHGWRCSPDVVEKGVDYRARIAALTPDATTETHDG